MRKFYITLGDGYRVTIGSYVRTIRKAKANLDRRFNRGLEDGWPVTGAQIVAEFRRGVEDRINQEVPYWRRGSRNE